MKKFKTMPGCPLPLGATIKPEGVNFAIFSRNATRVILTLFESATGNVKVEIPLDAKINKTGDIWHILILTEKPDLFYGFRMDGPHDPKGAGHYFNPDKMLLDPYALALVGGEEWGAPGTGGGKAETGFERRCLAVDGHFDWEGDRPLNIPLKDSIIYELHVRGFTRDKSAKVINHGTYAGIVEKIPYLRKLGITAVELMPITDFNENEVIHTDPTSGARLKNFWGYSPISFFAPKAAYARNCKNGGHIREFKEMVKALHRAGIEVILDIVFNHTAEGGDDGPIISFRGIDNTIYYLLAPDTRDYLNFSGCGNTLNCNHPLVRHLIMDCLRYWVIEMHVDGFRFDLAAIMGRDQQGRVVRNPPMVEKIAEDAILAKTKIIAEAWDAAGLYQVGSFSTSVRWAEWNGKFRDDVRAFMCGHENSVAALATRIAGSSDLYKESSRCPYNSINFVTSHDGFTLYDLVSYNEKHNLNNGEDNRDGSNHNISWNSGAEGETANPRIKQLRTRRIRSLAVILFLSQGVPMLAAGDEFGRSQNGNNNAYCQDNEISWLDWRLTRKNAKQLRFFRLLIKLRREHPVFRRADFFSGTNREIRWQSSHPGRQDWSPTGKTLAFFLNGVVAKNRRDDDFFVMLNGHSQTSHTFVVPPPGRNRGWLLIIDTAAPSPGDILPEDQGTPVKNGTKIKVRPMGTVVLISKPHPGK